MFLFRGWGQKHLQNWKGPSSSSCLRGPLGHTLPDMGTPGPNGLSVQPEPRRLAWGACWHLSHVSIFPEPACLEEKGDIGLGSALEIDPSVHREASKFKGLSCSIL